MEKRIKLLERKIKREILARKQAENILEKKALELFHVNQDLIALNGNLEQKAAEKAKELEQSQLRYRQMVESAHDIIYRIDSDGKIIYANSIILKILGYQPNDILGKYFWDFVTKDYKGKVIRFYGREIAEKNTQSYFEFPIHSRRGDLVWIGQNVSLIFENGMLSEGTAMARDITEQRYLKRELQRSEERYRGIIENMELGLMEVDLTGTIVKPYPRFCEMLDYSAEELIGQNAQEILLPERFIPVLERQDKDRKEGKAGIYEIQIKKKNGDFIWVLISGAPIMDSDGTITSTMGIHYDITAQKKLQADLELAKQVAEEAQEAEKQFLANMSHEIRTPLNAIIGMSHLLYDTNPSEEQRDYLSVLKSSSDLLHQLISDILDFSKIRAGKLELQEKEFDLKGIIKSLEKNFQLKLEGQPIEFSAFVGQGMENLMIGDDLLLNQILLNLLGNAAKFTTEGHIHLYVNLIAVKGKKRTFEFRVSDTGIGIPNDKLDLIFQTFRQVDGDIKRKFGGTGLGLTITKQLIDLQGGSVEVESEIGEGTTFIIRLEFEDSGRKIDLLQKEDAHINYESNAVKSILVVEDNYMNRKYISKLLEKWNYVYKMAHNGKEGVEMARQEKFDAIVMDIQMPVMDGYEATIAIRNVTNLNQNTPIIALTASAMVSQKNKAYDVGMTAYIPKPFKPHTLLNKLKSIQETHFEEETDDVIQTTFSFNEKLDVNYLNEVYEGDLDYAADMFNTFIEFTVPEIKSIKTYILQKDWSSVGRVGHKVKPAFMMVGLTSFFEKMEALEKKAKSDQEKKQLLQDFNIICEELETILPVIKSDLVNMSEVLNG